MSRQASIWDDENKALRAAALRIASDLPQGDPTRKKILAALQHREAFWANPATTSFEHLKKGLLESARQARSGLTDLSFTLGGDWSGYLGEPAPTRELLANKAAIDVAIRSLNAFDKDLEKWLRAMT